MSGFECQSRGFIQRAGLNAQILRAADGQSAQDARRYAAEINIADGKGTIYEQVRFLRNSGTARDADEALGRRERIGKKGRQAATIAFDAEANLYDAFINERLSCLRGSERY